MSLASAKNQTEVVIARKPDWDRVITVPKLQKGDQLIISTSNGGTVLLTYEMILQRSEDGVEFELAVQNVPLASSLKISLLRESNDFMNGACDIVLEAKKAGRKPTQRDLVLDLLISITTDRSSAINLVLSIMVIIVGTASLRSIGADTTLLYLLAALLSAYNLQQIVQRVQDGSEKGSKNQTLRVILHGHTFTSPDEPINVPENEIPQRFIDGCEGDLKEARRRWDITRHWRDAEGVNGILDEPQPHFTLIKTMYPHYHCGRGKEGHVVFYERPGDFQSAQLTARGIKTEQLVRHWLFTTEYQWQVMCGGDEMAKGISVIDINGITMGDLAGDNMNYLKKTIAFANAHYPERSHVIFIVNAPFFFSLLWKIVKPLVHENTQKKVKILSGKETLKGLQEHIHISNIPVYSGGECDYGGHDSCRFFSPDAIAFNEYVKAINDRHSGVQNKTPFDDVKQAPGNHLPPGKPGDVPQEDSNFTSVETADDFNSDKQYLSSGAPPPLSVTSMPGAMRKRGSITVGGRSESQESSECSMIVMFLMLTLCAVQHGDDWSVASGTTNGMGASRNGASPKASSGIASRPPASSGLTINTAPASPSNAGRPPVASKR